MNIDEKFDKIVELITVGFERTNEQLSELNERVGRLETEVSELKTDVSELKTDVSELKGSVHGINLRIENGIESSIRQIAEGHCFIEKNLQEILRRSDTMELLTVKSNIHDGKIAELERKIS